MAIEIWWSSGPPWVFDVIPPHGELPSPISHFQIRERFRDVQKQQLGMNFLGRKALDMRDFD
jgi:hypothetical protein